MSIRVYPKPVYGSFNLSNPDDLVRPRFSGWQCADAVIEPKKEGAIVLCEACANAVENGAEIERVKQ